MEDLKRGLNSIAKRQASAVLDLIKVADKATSNLKLFSTSTHFTNQD